MNFGGIFRGMGPAETKQNRDSFVAIAIAGIRLILPPQALVTSGVFRGGQPNEKLTDENQARPNGPTEFSP